MTLKQSSRLGSIALLAILPICLLLPADVLAESPHSVISIKASNPLLHGLEVKTALDSERRWVNLRGPELYSFPDVVEKDVVPSYLTWYEIRKPKSEPVKEVVLADAFSGEQSFRVMLGAPAYYLIPAQTIQDGPPQEIPENLNHFIAFRISNVDSLELPEPTPGKPAFVCVPAEEWHHADHSPIKAATKLFMVYEVDSQSSDRKVTAIDQFGLNGLTGGKTQFIYVKAERK